MKTTKLLALTLALVAVRAEARTFEEIKKDGKIIVASEGAFPPFNFFRGPTLTGFEIDVAEALAKKMGVGIEWRALSFDALLAGLRQDRWDMVIASFGITEERAKAVTFTNPHYCSGGVIVAKDPAIRTVKDLAGKIVAVQTGTTYLEHVQKVPGVKEVKNFPKDTDARAALVAGRVDAWVSDRFVAKAALESNPAAGLKMGDFVFVERIASAVKKGNTSLEKAIDKALAEIMADGTYEAISKKYMNEDVRCR
ncbi:ABC transporter substrate-binding protein [Anaeromyxobacter diazotrophicus]|uniref:Amino acid ABC transporter substrate-binding protein n=1 Tax=Anaeromyxobacter diazotrophicus TaxID=2590199 RepID=A0A7I9VI20_9BACT|nr:ABC transporter substrate-binding protein [Anaeromyxobacter diazotrophicus]GEJ55768.1 amino acid ABC transporter substrate-binding protein [Anaeromyxobacter diazotrophicus]